MSYTAQQLITASWYLSGIVARNLQTPTGDQITDGLQLLNNLLNFKQVEIDLIPYYTYLQLNLTSGQEYYFLPNVAAIEGGTFNINTVRYPMMPTSRRRYFMSSRVNNISTLPFDWNFNRGEGGGTWSLYFLPGANYTANLMVKFFLTNVSLNTDLTNVSDQFSAGFVSSLTCTSNGSGYTSSPTVTITGGGGTGAAGFASVCNGAVTGVTLTNPGQGYTSNPNVAITGGGGTGAAATAITTNYTFPQTANAGYDTSYVEYLRYALAQYFCSEYGIVFNPQSQAILEKYQRELMYMGPPDLSLSKLSILTETAQGFNYGDASIGQGWRPA